MVSADQVIEGKHITGNVTINRPARCAIVGGAINVCRVQHPRRYRPICRHRQVHHFQQRNPVSPLRGQLVQLSHCSGGAVIEEFSAECDPAIRGLRTSLTSSPVRSDQHPTRSNRRRNSPVGCSVMVEDTPSGVLIEDVDIIHQYNGAFAAHVPKSVGVTYRRGPACDQILTPLLGAAHRPQTIAISFGRPMRKVRASSR
jgi:hypothetical protein